MSYQQSLIFASPLYLGGLTFEIIQPYTPATLKINSRPKDRPMHRLSLDRIVFGKWSPPDYVALREPPSPPRYKSSAMKIEMMIHFAVTVEPFSPERCRTSPAYTKFVKELLRDGMIKRPTDEQREEHPGWAYKATDRGRAYVEALKDVQLPVAETTWSVPA